jgi:hypothetical protein
LESNHRVYHEWGLDATVPKFEGFLKGYEGTREEITTDAVQVGRQLDVDMDGTGFG